MSEDRKAAKGAGVPPDDAEVAFLAGVFREQLRLHGRAHHRGLLEALRKRLGTAATEKEQEVAMMLRRKLRWRPPKVKDVTAVRRALEADAAAGGDVQ